MTSTLTLENLQQFIGDDIRYQHSLNGDVIYTPGIRYLTQTGGAYWLLDEIAMALGSTSMARWTSHDARLAEMQFWKLTVNDDASADLIGAADAGVPPFFSKRIAWTDFPLSQIDVWCAYDGMRWTMYLPSEH